jgi:hypothetical protein
VAPILTVFFPDRRFVDDIMVVNIRVKLELLQLEIDGIDSRDETVVITRRASRPILTKVREHVDMLSDEVHDRFAETDVEVPLPSTVPLERGRHCTPDLERDVSNHAIITQLRTYAA